MSITNVPTMEPTLNPTILQQIGTDNVYFFLFCLSNQVKKT